MCSWDVRPTKTALLLLFIGYLAKTYAPLKSMELFITATLRCNIHNTKLKSLLLSLFTHWTPVTYVATYRVIMFDSKPLYQQYWFYGICDTVNKLRWQCISTLDALRNCSSKQHVLTYWEWFVLYIMPLTCSVNQTTSNRQPVPGNF